MVYSSLSFTFGIIWPYLRHLNHHLSTTGEFTDLFKKTCKHPSDASLGQVHASYVLRHPCGAYFCIFCFFCCFFCVLQASLQRAGSCLDKCKVLRFRMISLPRCPHCLIQHCGRDYMQMWPSTVLVVACSASQSYTQLEAWRWNHESSHVFPFPPQTRLAFLVS